MRISPHFVTQHHKDSTLPNVLYELISRGRLPYIDREYDS